MLSGDAEFLNRTGHDEVAYTIGSRRSECATPYCVTFTFISFSRKRFLGAQHNRSADEIAYVGHVCYFVAAFESYEHVTRLPAC